MSYESRIYVADVSTPYPETLAALNLSCVDDPQFTRLFNNELIKPDEVFFVESDNPIIEDCYGCKIKYAELSDVIAYAERRIEIDNYRRMHPLLGLLKGFCTEDWIDEDNHIVVLHYGY